MRFFIFRRFDDYLPFCAADKKTGELKGALKDYLIDASTCLLNAELSFEPVAYSSSAAAIEALRKGEVDCIFPSTLSASDGEQLDLIMTPSMIASEVFAVVRESDQNTFFQKEQVTAAVIENDPNYETVMMDHFPDWQRKEYADIQACLKAVADGQADCTLISNYQFKTFGKQLDKLELTELATGKSPDYCIAVQRSNSDLYSILTRITDIVSDTSVNSALSYYSAEEEKTTLLDFIRDNPAVDIAIVVVVIALLTVIIAQRHIIRANREVEESRHQLNDLNKRVFVDALTSVRNMGSFKKYIQDLQEKLDHDETLVFAVAVLDCDDLKAVNDQYGHDKGDVYIKTASRLICRVFSHSPVFRIGGDEFAVILQNEDYQNRKELKELFEKKTDEICASAENTWDQVSVALGMAEYDPQTDASVDDVVRRADKTMYENKRTRKEKISASE